MYLIHVPAEKAGVDHWLFFDEDPRPRGCSRQAVEGVEFRDLQEPAPDLIRPQSGSIPRLARSLYPPWRYQVFPSRLSASYEFEYLDGFAFHFPTWEAFMETPIAKDRQWRTIS